LLKIEISSKTMEKGKKTEEFNQALSVNEDHSKRLRLQGHIDSITGKFTSIGKTWYEIGEELFLIREEKDFTGTFDSFVKATWDKTRDWAYKLIDAYEAVKQLPAGVEHGIQNPRQALALASAPIDKRAAIMENVNKSGKKVTNTSIKKEIDKQKAVDAVVDELDGLGNKIPKDILDEWNRAKEESKQSREDINRVKRWFKTGTEEGARDPIFRAVAQSNAKLFTDVLRQIALVDPYAVCPTCKGTTKHDGKKCKQCKGTGFISKFEFETVNSGNKKAAKKPAAKKEK
jgi:hypothetical protein